jgi:hypothetical protein
MDQFPQGGPILPDPGSLPQGTGGAGGPFAVNGQLPIGYFKTLDILARSVFQADTPSWQGPGYNSRPIVATAVRTLTLTNTWIDVLTYKVPDRHVTVLTSYCATIAGDMTLIPVQFRLKRLRQSGTGDFAVNLAPGTGIDRFKIDGTTFPAIPQPIQIISDQDNPVIIQARYPAGASVRVICGLFGSYYKTNELVGRGPRAGGGDW